VLGINKVSTVGDCRNWAATCLLRTVAPSNPPSPREYDEHSRKMIYSLFFTISQRMQNLDVQHLGHVSGALPVASLICVSLSDIDERALPHSFDNGAFT